MEDLQREAELVVGKLGVGDIEGAGREPGRQPPAPAEQLEEIVLAAEDQRAFAGIDGERHADAPADIFLEAGRAGEPLGGMDHLREALAARIEPRPDLAAHPLRDRHQAGGMGAREAAARTVSIAGQRQWAADQTCGLGEPPAGAAHPGVQDLAGVDHRASAHEPLAEAAADRERQRGPVLVGHQRAEAHIAQLRAGFGFRLGRQLRFRPAIETAVEFEGESWRTHGALLANYFLPSGSRPTIRVPRRMRAASLLFGTVSICACQRSSDSTKVSRSVSRLRATGWSFGSDSASATQALSAPTAGSISRSWRTASIRMAISNGSVSASKCSRRSPLTGTRRIRFQAISSRIEVETLERASPSEAAISSAVSGRSDK